MKLDVRVTYPLGTQLFVTLYLSNQGVLEFFSQSYDTVAFDLQARVSLGRPRPSPLLEGKGERKAW